MSVKNNAHIHLPPNFSAFQTVAQAVALAADEGLKALGATNYYDYSVYRTFAAEAENRGIVPLFGLEIITLVPELQAAGVKVNDPGNPGKFYLCGKGVTQFDPLTETGESLLGVIRQSDSGRMAAMVEKIASLLAESGVEATLTEAGIKERVAARHGCPVDTVFLQERHVAQAVQEAVFAAGSGAEREAVLTGLFGGTPSKKADDAGTVQGEVRSHLMKAGKPGYVPETFVGFDHAYALILAMGGVPCYPSLADGASPVCGFEETPEKLVAALQERNLYCAEFIPVRNSPEVLREYVRALRAAGIVVTAGTEHNTPELIPLTPTCVKSQPIPEDVQAIFDEGVCVVAAHQHRVARGEAGFVDAQGVPNGSFADAEARIRAFAAEGRGLIERG